MKLLILVSLFFGSSAVADESALPNFESAPWKYEHRHEIPRVAEPSPVMVTDELLIGDVSDKEVKFYFYLIRTNGHTCGASGVASFQDGSYYYTIPSVKLFYEDGKLKKKPAECRLRLRFDANQALLQDEGGNCKQALCRTRAYIGNVRFERIK